MSKKSPIQKFLDKTFSEYYLVGQRKGKKNFTVSSNLSLSMKATLARRLEVEVDIALIEEMKKAGKIKPEKEAKDAKDK